MRDSMKSCVWMNGVLFWNMMSQEACQTDGQPGSQPTGWRSRRNCVSNYPCVRKLGSLRRFLLRPTGGPDWRNCVNTSAVWWMHLSSMSDNRLPLVNPVSRSIWEKLVRRLQILSQCNWNCPRKLAWATIRIIMVQKVSWCFSMLHVSFLLSSSQSGSFPPPWGYVCSLINTFAIKRALRNSSQSNNRKNTLK